MTRFSFVQRAEPGERFARDAFDSQIGKRIPHIDVTVIAAKVLDGGSAIEITVETDSPEEI